MSLFANPKKDFLWLIFPGVLSLGALFVLREQISEVISAILIYLAYFFFDAGHVFTSIFRFERKSSKQLLIPLTIFSMAFGVGLYFESIFMWMIIIYMTFIHNLKQSYGISAWLGGLRGPRLKYLFYTLNTLAFIGFHFRDLHSFGNLYPVSSLLALGTLDLPPVIFSTIMALHLFLLILLIGKIYFSQARGLALFYPIFMSGIYMIAFFMSSSVHEVMIPLIVTHGATYMGLIELSAKKLYQRSFFFGIISVAAVFGCGEYFAFGTAVSRHLSSGESYATILLVVKAFFLGSLFTHYYLDGKIWKKDHPQAVTIYSS